MPTYNVTVSRAYLVRVKARNATTAMRASEFFLGDSPDDSLKRPDMRKQFGFTIEEIKMVENDAINVEQVSNYG